ncbi:hypothetical protein U9M48_021642 [Paspalum notatum var. saurae]|uniref:Uncharacterized protein n=1 Tax=Paspalum notatum var. saurae TaxID=547442 RepID=A0AAQ3TL24_PASNO
MIVHKYIGSRPCFSLHRINPWSCFYPTAQQALAAADANNRTIMEDACLPRASLSLYKPRPPHDIGDITFVSLGQSSNEIIAMDQDGNTLLCEASSHVIGMMPSPHEPMLAPISLRVGGSLYVLDSVPEYDQTFEALVYPGDSCFKDKWYWHSLPSPPFGVPEYEHEEVVVQHKGESRWNRYVVQAYTVVGDSEIWISTVGGGTYSFNTASGMWSKTGRWALPFYGHVKYAPEHGLWFGFSSENGKFTASDLTATPSTTNPPVLQKAWNELAQPLPDRWVPMESYLQPLGAGKFCIVRTFLTAQEGWCRKKDGNCFDNKESFAVFTGVEVERGRKGALRMIKHKSRRYSFRRWRIQPL